MDALVPEFAHGVGVFAGYVSHIYIAVYGNEVCHGAALDFGEVLHLLW